MTTLAEELRELRRLKDEAEEVGRVKKEADLAFKKQQARALERMEIEQAESFRTGGDNSYLFTAERERVKGQVEDRRDYVRWCLENDEAIIEFVDWMGLACDDRAEFTDRFIDAITSTSQVSYKEDGHVMNQQARSHVDDGAPLPPGLTFRPDPRIRMRKS